MPIPTEPRNIDFPEKMQFLFEPAKYKVGWGGRMGLKSWSFARALLWLGVQKSERVLCARELQKSLDESVHRLLADQISLMGMNYLYDVQQAHIYGRGSAKGTMFSFEGIRHNTNKIKSYEGITRCWIEEAAKLSRNSWGIIEPTVVRNREAEIWLSLNLEEEEDFIYQYFIVHRPPPGSVVVRTTWRDNKWLPDEAIASIIHLRETNYDEYLHVYEGYTRQILEGAIFAEELRDCVEQGRITNVPVEASTPVDVFFDLGRNDFTAMWFVQRVGFEFHVIDFYQERLKHIDHYLKVLQSRGYLYGTIWLPHDAKAKQLGARNTIEEQVALAGFHKRLVPKVSNIDKHNAARSVFPKCYFDASRTQEGIRGLRNYHYEVDPATGHFSKNPDHDGSDPADAFCYFAVASGLRQGRVECKLERPRSLQEGLIPGISSAINGIGKRILDLRPARSNGWLSR
jgi:phage terminase large subunit